MKKLYVLLLVALLVSTATPALAAKAGSQVGATQDQEQTRGAEADGNQHQKQYVETGLAGDGIKNSIQDPDGIGEITPPCQSDPEAGATCTPVGDQLQDRDRDRDRIEEQTRLQTRNQEMLEVIGQMQRLLQQIRQRLAELRGQ